MVIAPFGATDAWPAACWCTVIDDIVATYDLPEIIVLAGSHDDAAAFERPCVRVLRDHPLPETVDLIRNALLLVSSDAALGHIAHYLGTTRHLVLFPTAPPPTHPVNPRARTLSGGGETAAVLDAGAVLATIHDMLASEPRAMRRITCFVDGMQGYSLIGWAVRPHAAQPASLSFVVDDKVVGSVTCDIDRPDVRNAGLTETTAGFAFLLPDSVLDGGLHRLGVQDARGVFVRFHGEGVPGISWEFHTPRMPLLRGHIDGIEQGCFRGWVIRRDDNAWKGGAQIEIRSNGVRITTTRADRYRLDVARQLGADHYCGFEVPVPPAFQRTPPQTFSAFVVPDEQELGGSPFTCAVVTDRDQHSIAQMSDIVERVYKEIIQLRGQVRAMKHEERYTIPGYDRWYRLYRDRLHARVHDARERVALGESARGVRVVENQDATPRISIVMPAFRPEMTHFRQAVESVLAQTWRNWELLIVDDRSDSPELDAYLQALADSHENIVLLKNETNVGISEATNRALRAASGRWIAFFDHDDLLDHVALEVMVRAAQGTGARLLYSDEDKIDVAGRFSEPAFKPDFSPRLLLSCNYICHLVLIDADLARQVGPLRKSYDGAQDFDFVLRATELLDPAEVHHVREVLYHWRKTRTSTAADVSTKTYAITAGARAVSDHLTRIGHGGKVVPIGLSTLYRVAWDLPKVPPRTCIIIPFRDQADSTRRCLEAVRQHTDMRRHEVILVDNWSSEPATAALVAEASCLQGVRVMRVEEDFNYSRLNNLAAAQSDAAFFVFMNNDLYLETDDWLPTLLGEALRGDRVGVVGGKFLYPNRSIQHAGVVVGLSGVAGHSYAGRAEDYPGYLGRAIVAQDMSAVTAACMLVRSQAFRDVGGFDETNLKVAFNDIDLCLRLRERGFGIVWTPEFIAEHHESLSRGSDDRPEVDARFHDEILFMQSRWEGTLTDDPFYSRFLSLGREAFHDLIDPRTDDHPLDFSTRGPVRKGLPHERDAAD